MPRGKKHPPDLRSKVIADLLAGMGVRDVAAKHGISQVTVHDWKVTEDASKFEQVRTEKALNLVELVEQHLVASLETATEIARVVRDEQWIRKQDAASLGTLYGILSDKALRILEAAERARERKAITEGQNNTALP